MAPRARNTASVSALGNADQTFSSNVPWTEKLIGYDEGTLSDEHVAAGDDESAVGQRGQVGYRAGAEAGPAQRLAVHPEPRDAAVGVDVEPEMGDAVHPGDGKWVLGVAPQSGAAEDLPPRGARSIGQLLGGSLAIHRGSVERALLGIVAPEEAGVHHDAPYQRGNAG